MQATKIFANLRVADIEAAKGFYTDYLGLTNEEFNMGWVARYSSADAGARLQLVTGDATAAEDSVISVCTMTSTRRTRRHNSSATTSSIH